MPSPAHLISKIGDPIFAFFIGLSAAATRINREEKELGHSTKETIDAGFRYFVNDHCALEILEADGFVLQEIGPS
jgi:hypothetical protein